MTPTPHPDLAPYPNVKKALVALLNDLADDCGTKAPGNGWNGETSALRVRVLGGPERGGHTDVVYFDVDALTSEENTSDDLAELVRQRITAAGGHRVGGYIFDTAGVTTRPHTVPWGASNAVVNTTASYRVSARRLGG